MNKDKISSLLLAGLILTSILLTSQIWFTKKLWSDDYNFFVTLKNNETWSWMTSFFNPRTEIQVQKDAYMPSALVVNDGVIRIKVLKGSPQYEQWKEQGSIQLKKLFQAAQGTRVEMLSQESDWQAALKSRSVLLSFKQAYPIKFLAALLGEKDTQISNSVKDVEAILISFGEAATNDISIYVKSPSSGYAKFIITTDITPITAILEKNFNISATGYKYSYELNFDQKRKNKVVLKSEILIPFKPIEVVSLKVKELENYRTLLPQILKHFGHSVNNPNRYTETDNTDVYVENDSTFKVESDQIIEYRAVTMDKGFKIIDDKEPVTADYLQLLRTYEAVLQFINKLGTDNMDLELTKIEYTDAKPSAYTFSFDYRVNGISVKMKDERGKVSSGVKLTVAGNSLVYYRQILRGFELGTKGAIKPPIPEVLDQIYEFASKGTEDLRVSDISLCYEMNKNGSFLLPAWDVVVEGKGIHTIPSSQTKE